MPPGRWPAERRTLTPDLNPELLPDGQVGLFSFNMLMDVNPRHERYHQRYHQRYHERMPGCQVLGDQRINKSVNAPAVLMG